MLCRQSQKAAGWTPAEKEVVEGLAYQLRLRAVGGSSTAHAALAFDAYSLANEQHW
jgi:hypothetical protein